MNSLARIALSRQMLSTMAPRAFGVTVTAAGPIRSMSLGTDLARKEKVEEDRYIRQKEHEEYLVRKEKANTEAAARELSEAEMKAKELHDRITGEIFSVLALTGDKLSDECVGNLADWKLEK